MGQTALNALYVIFAVGAISLFFLMPGANRSRKAVGIGLGLLTIAGLLAVPALGSSGLAGSRAFFVIFATIALIGGVRVITHPKPVYSAIYFVLVVVATACLVLLQSAEFLAVALIIIYAGAILVTYLFVIMLAQQPAATVYDENAREPLAAVLTGFVLVAAIVGHIGAVSSTPRSNSAVTLVSETVAGGQGESPSNTMSLGASLLTRYVVVLQLGGILLLISMVGAIALSRKRMAVEKEWPRAPLGQIGREVDPF